MIVSIFKALTGLIVIGLLMVFFLFTYRHYRSIPEFQNGFENGYIDKTKWIIDKKGECDIDIAEDIVRSGKYSVRFKAGKNARCELLPWPYANLLDRQLREPFGQDRWYAFSTYLEKNWQPIEQNEMIAQWHSSTDIWFNEVTGMGPPLGLRVKGNEWYITYGWGSELISRRKRQGQINETLWSGEINPGTWDDWIFHVRWSQDETGLVKIWKNGRVIAQRSGPISYNDIRGVYLKVGNYHPSTDRVLYMDSIQMANSEISPSSQ